MYSLQENDSFSSNPRFLRHQINCKPYVRWMCIGEKHKNLNFKKMKKPQSSSSLETWNYNRATVLLPTTTARNQSLFSTNNKQQKWPSMSNTTSPFDKRRARERKKKKKGTRKREHKNWHQKTIDQLQLAACFDSENSKWAKLRTGRQASWLVSTEAFQELLLQTST